MNEQQMLNCQVQQWEIEGRWVDSGRWVRDNWGSTEHHPTQQEIVTKCCLFRMRAGRHGAHAWAPRGGEFALATTAGI